jgi:hypothetical protein
MTNCNVWPAVDHLHKLVPLEAPEDDGGATVAQLGSPVLQRGDGAAAFAGGRVLQQRRNQEECEQQAELHRHNSDVMPCAD